MFLGLTYSLALCTHFRSRVRISDALLSKGFAKHAWRSNGRLWRFFALPAWRARTKQHNGSRLFFDSLAAPPRLRTPGIRAASQDEIRKLAEKLEFMSIPCASTNEAIAGKIVDVSGRTRFDARWCFKETALGAHDFHTVNKRIWAARP